MMARLIQPHAPDRLVMKRMTKERADLEKPNSDYFVSFKDENLLDFYAYVIGPEDSVYQFKLIKLHFQIPTRYPLVPPKVKLIQHTGHRIHPNLYHKCGKVCLSILGTWQGEPWAFAMSSDTVLITIRSLLDAQPYVHEPGQKDHPAFNNYVKYTSWQCLLLDYVEREQDPAARTFLQRHLRDNAAAMITELARQETAYNMAPPSVPSSINPTGASLITSPYGDALVPNYYALRTRLTAAIEAAREELAAAEKTALLTATGDAIDPNLFLHQPQPSLPPYGTFASIASIAGLVGFGNSAAGKKRPAEEDEGSDPTAVKKQCGGKGV